jgi:hypothetical protein
MLVRGRPLVCRDHAYGIATSILAIRAVVGEIQISWLKMLISAVVQSSLCRVLRNSVQVELPQPNSSNNINTVAPHGALFAFVLHITVLRRCYERGHETRGK